MVSCNLEVTIDASLLHRQGLTGLYQPAMPEGYAIVFRDEGSWYLWKRDGRPGIGSAHKDPAAVVRHAWAHAGRTTRQRLADTGLFRERGRDLEFDDAFAVLVLEFDSFGDLVNVRGS